MLNRTRKEDVFMKNLHSVFRLRAFPNRKDRYQDFISNNFIAIGWPLIGDITNDSREEISAKLNEHYGKDFKTKQVLGLTTGFFIRLQSMEIGDLVLIPYQDSITIAEVTRPYYFNKELVSEHMAHSVGIKVLKDISISELPIKLKRSIDTMTTLIDLTNYRSEVDELIRDTSDSVNLDIKERETISYITDNNNKTIMLTISSNVNIKDMTLFINQIFKDSQ